MISSLSCSRCWGGQQGSVRAHVFIEFINNNYSRLETLGLSHLWQNSLKSNYNYSIQVEEKQIHTYGLLFYLWNSRYFLCLSWSATNKIKDQIILILKAATRPKVTVVRIFQGSTSARFRTSLSPKSSKGCTKPTFQQYQLYTSPLGICW